MRTLLELRILHYLAETGGDSVAESVCPSADQMEIRYRFLKDGLVVRETTLAAGLFTLTAKGRAAANAAHHGLRRRLIQLRILEAAAEGHPGDVEYITGFDPVVGEPGKEEVIRNAFTLKEERLITGMEVYGSIGAPKLTSLGERALESEYAPEEFLDSRRLPETLEVTQHPSPAQHVEFNGPVGAAQFGENNTATVTQNIGINAPDLAQVLAAVRGLAAEHGTLREQEDIEYRVETIEGDFESGRKQRAIAGLTSLASAVTTAFGEEVGQGVADQITGLLGSLT